MLLLVSAGGGVAVSSLPEVGRVERAPVESCDDVPAFVITFWQDAVISNVNNAVHR